MVVRLLNQQRLLKVVYEYLRAERRQAGDENGERAVIEAYETLTHVRAHRNFRNPRTTGRVGYVIDTSWVVKNLALQT
jgi:hypothetical protein